ncbi:hypothetical protein [Nonomuraea basaltis]|uniref:hypothetical protein n=1 Tax=Nonomuraea basaltis TaxID=2495887 RepID=UPI00110C5A0E|nr:hypothetical protein [Nonomuraea basaltis]TMR97571.1 hypothetical protein EJK15_17795 [Nonomuraea basaltis]
MTGDARDVHVTDQIQAAADDARRIYESLSDPVAHPIVPIHSVWVATAVTEFLAVYGPDPRGCVHLDHPQPLYGFVAVPGGVLCRECVSNIIQGAKLGRCDHCGIHCAAQELSYGLINGGILTLIFVLCHPCNSIVVPGYPRPVV